MRPPARSRPTRPATARWRAPGRERGEPHGQRARMHRASRRAGETAPLIVLCLHERAARADSVQARAFRFPPTRSRRAAANDRGRPFADIRQIRPCHDRRPLARSVRRPHTPASARSRASLRDRCTRTAGGRRRLPHPAPRGCAQHAPRCMIGAPPRVIPPCAGWRPLPARKMRRAPARSPARAAGRPHPAKCASTPRTALNSTSCTLRWPAAGALRLHGARGIAARTRHVALSPSIWGRQRVTTVANRWLGIPGRRGTAGACPFWLYLQS